MFTVASSIVLPHTVTSVRASVGRLAVLPRWCRGLRVVRLPRAAEGPCSADTCVLTYRVGALRLHLTARTRDDSGRIVHEAAGEGPQVGLCLTWTFVLAPHADGTELQAELALTVDSASPLAPHRAALGRQLAHRIPADLARLREQLGRRAAASDAMPAARLPRGPHPATDGHAGV